jgi:hypothetical protein
VDMCWLPKGLVHEERRLDTSVTGLRLQKRRVIMFSIQVCGFLQRKASITWIVEGHIFDVRGRSYQSYGWTIAFVSFPESGFK